jgi:hypothetical protein
MNIFVELADNEPSDCSAVVGVNYLQIRLDTGCSPRLGLGWLFLGSLFSEIKRQSNPGS